MKRRGSATGHGEMRMRRKPREVRRHATGVWVISIGKHVGNDGRLHNETNWYFPRNLAKEQADRQAAMIQGQWNRIVETWQTIHRPRLLLERMPHADVPHWLWPESSIPKAATSAGQITAHAAEMDPASDGAVDDELTLRALASLYAEDRRMSLDEGDIQNATFMASVQRVDGALRYLPEDLPVSNLNAIMIREAKARMLERLKRRSAANLLVEFGRMLKWFYDSPYGQEHRRVPGLDKSLLVRKSKSTAITTYTETQLKALLEKTDDRKRMLILLSLNCGMYGVDIGRLRKSEISLSQGYCHWDREKEPMNPFHLYHELWPETLNLVRRYYNYESSARAVDYRSGKPEKVDCRVLAFVSYRDGKPLYRIGPSGSPVNRVDRWLLPLGVSIYSLRKTTNQMLIETARLAATDPGALIAIGELSRMFLGQRSELLARLYSHSEDPQSARIMYRQVNYYLGLVGDRLRHAGVFDCVRT